MLSRRPILPVLFAALAVFGQASAHAQESYSHVRMRPEGAEIPMIEISAGTEVSDSPEALVQVLLGFEYRGIEGKEEGQFWARVYAEGGINPVSGELTGFRVEFTPYRSMGESDPLPVAWDMQLFNFVASRDRTLGRELDATIKVLGFSGGIYLPATDPGDFEIMAVLAVEALGGRIRQYSEAEMATFYGGYLAGIGAEIAFGKKLTTDFTVTGHFGGGADWSLGGGGNGFSVVIDSRVFANLTVGYRELLEFAVGGEYEHTSDSASDFSRGVLRFLASIRMRF